MFAANDIKYKRIYETEWYGPPSIANEDLASPNGTNVPEPDDKTGSKVKKCPLVYAVTASFLGNSKPIMQIELYHCTALPV